MTTLYLTGYPNERYRELIQPIKTLRINDMEKLQEELRRSCRELKIATPKHDEVYKRYAAVTAAIKFWKYEV